MAYSPYLSNGYDSEYNMNGDSYNGTTGAKTEPAIKSQSIQQKQSSGNAYQNALQGTAKYAHLLYNGPQMPPPQAPVQPPTAQPPQQVTGPAPTGGQAGQAAQSVKPPGNESYPDAIINKLLSQTGTGFTPLPASGQPQTPGQPAQLPGGNAQYGEQAPAQQPGQQPMNQPDYGAIAAGYAKNPGYEWVTGALVKQYQDEMYSDPAKFKNVDFVDWAKAKGYNSPLAGRAGYDTYLYTDANLTPRFPPPQPDITQFPGGGGDFGQQNPPGTPGGPSEPHLPDIPGLAPQSDEYLKNLMQKINAAYGSAANERFRDVRHQAGVSGLQNQGAFANVMADEASSLAAQQGREIAQAMQGSSEAERTRQLQELLGRLGLEGTREQAGASRFATSTGADVARQGDQLRYLLGLRGQDVDRELGYAGYDVTREGNALQQQQQIQQMVLQYLMLLGEQNPDNLIFGAGPILGGVYG